MNQAFASLGRITGPFVGSVLFLTGKPGTLPFALAAAVLVAVLGLVGRVKTERG